MKTRYGLLLTGGAAALMLAVGMGFGRFAFTALYPHMVREGLLTVENGSWAASGNYTGYLLGALAAVGFRQEQAHRICRYSLFATALCLLLTASAPSAAVFTGLRTVSGILSAFVIVSASQWLLGHKDAGKAVPLLYSGVGLGITLSAELVEAGLYANLNSRHLWLMLGALSLLVCFAVGPVLKADSAPAGKNTAAGLGLSVRSLPLTVLYGLAGFGYIITATYLPLLADLALPDFPSAHLWAVFGLGAAPSCFIWHYLQLKLNGKTALILNLAVQAAGVMLPVVLPNAAGYLLSALLVGGTFMGTVTLVMPLARESGRKTGRNMMAVVTAAYGLGQISGPPAAHAFYRHSHTFDAGLAAAATALLAATVLSFFLTHKES